MEQEQVIITMRALKGAPASLVLAMLLMPQRVSVGVMEFTTITGYGKDAVRNGLQTLESLGMVQQLGRYQQWALTAKAQQLGLGQAALEEAPGGGKNALPLSEAATVAPVCQHAAPREGGKNALAPTGDAAPTEPENREGGKNALAPTRDAAPAEPENREGGKNALALSEATTAAPVCHHAGRREGGKNALAPPTGAETAREGGKNALPAEADTCTCCSCCSSSSLNNKTTTTTCDVDEKIARSPPEVAPAPGKDRLPTGKDKLPPEWEAVVETMVQQCGTPRRYARQAIRAARTRGEIPPYVTWNTLRWLEYCYDPQCGQGIKNPALFIARKVEAGQECPEKFKVADYSERGQELQALYQEWQRLQYPDTVPRAEPEEEAAAAPEAETAAPEGELGAARTLWQQALRELELQMTRATFETWLHGTQVVAVKNGAEGEPVPVLVVRVKNQYAVEWLSGRLYALIIRTVRRVTPEAWEVRFVEPEAVGLAA